MANQFTLTAGAKTYTIPIKLTALQIKNMVVRYAKHYNIPLTTTDAEGVVTPRTDDAVVEEVFRSVLASLASVSKHVQQQEEAAKVQAGIDATVNADNDLFT